MTKRWCLLVTIALTGCGNIESVEPNPAQSGAQVRIDGTGFGDAPGSVQVLYDGAPLAVNAWSPTT
ncbi:MAG: IPT/TIG domain-containing protein, partial [Myxococcales bacterium]|nr:IPT/TIG domain-containing protein [Myxococcales bacterium]